MHTDTIKTEQTYPNSLDILKWFPIFSLRKVSVPGNLWLRQGKDMMNQWYFISNTFFPPQKGHPTVLNTVFEWGNLTISSFPSISLIYLFIFQPSTNSKRCPLRLFWWRPKVLRPEIHNTSVQSLLSTQRERNICDTIFDKNHPKSSLKTNLQGMCDHLQEAKIRRHTNHTSNNMRNTFKAYHQLVCLIFTNCNPCCIWSMLDGLQRWWILKLESQNGFQWRITPKNEVVGKYLDQMSLQPFDKLIFTGLTDMN